jgi:A/G-specific adenine glycosylase
VKKINTKAFQNNVWNVYKKEGRVLPWRKTQNPYFILVSEIMLQQTQVERVVPKYRQWLKQFPTADALARAPRAQVLLWWQGLGYNRRAIFLQQAAEALSTLKTFPREEKALRALPGVGAYTARAVLAFAFNQPVVLIETNIRTVFIHHFFPNQKKVHDKELLPYIEKTLDRDNPREWYWALMDYEAKLKKELGNSTRQSAHYVKQSRFKGSKRELRGKIITLLTHRGVVSKGALAKAVKSNSDSLTPILGGLVKDGLVQESRPGVFSL